MARLEEFDDVQLDVEFTQAGTRSNLTSKENIAISFGKIAKWYEALVPTGGSSGQFLGFNSSGTAKWVSNPNTDQNVKATKLAQSTAEASYYPTLVAGEGTAGVSIIDSTKINHTPGTTSIVGNTRLILGNGINEGTTNNEAGLLRIYSSGTKYHTLKGAKITTDNVDHTLPTIGGTILNTGTTSFTQTLSSGTKIGTIKINGTSSDIYAPTDTDTKVTQTNTTTSADYRVLLSGNANDTTETTTGRKSTNLRFNPSSGGLYSFGFLWTDITGQTLDINTLTLSNGTLHSRRFIEKTDGGAANITNIPVTGHPFLLEVDLIRWGSTTDYITRQRFTNAANGTYSYVRYCTNGTWGSWTTRKYTDTDTKVTSSANHYTPATASGQDKSASASGATAAWSIDVVKGVTLNTDGKGHVTGISVTSGKIPANPVPSNNVTGSGTSGYLTKWNGTNTITNGPQLGSSTTTFLRNDGTWATPTDTDEKVKATKLAQSTAEASYYPTLVSAAGTAGVSIFDSAKINHTPGTTSAVGNTRLILGNATASGTANNEEGLLKLYSPGTSYHTLKGASTSSVVEHTLPTTGGTILNSGTTSFTQTLSSGTKIGTIKINGTSTDLYCQTNTNTDTQVRQSATTTEDFRPILMGATHVSGSSTGLDATVTGEAYVSTKLYCQPKTGNLYVTGDIKRANNTLSLWSGNDYAGVSQRNNYDINTWYGFSVSNACTTTGTLNGVAFSVNARNGQAWHTGNVHLYSASGDSPALVFQRGTFVDNLNDWKIYVSGGELRFAQSTANASSETWTTKMHFHSSDGNLYVGSTKVSLEGHTHNYAGSSSAGGAATSANILNKNNTAGATTTGVQYANGQLTVGTADGNAVEGSNGSYKLWSYPTGGTAVGGGTANIQNLRLYWSSAYFRDIFISPNNYDIYHRSVAAGTAQPWRKILDSGNYTSYALPRNIKHIHTASGTEGSTGWVKIARITVTHAYANHPMTFTIAQRGVMQYRIHLVLVNNESVAAAAISEFIIARDNSWTDTNNYPRAYIIKPSDGIFDLYIRKIEGYDHIFVVDFTKADGSDGDNYSVAWTNVHAADSEITGGTEAVKKLYLSTSGGTMTGELKQQLQLRVYHGNYGAILRSDGLDTYFLVTDSGSAASGSWNSLRPFAFSNSTGLVSMGNGAKISSSSYGALSIIRTDANNAGIKFYNNSSTYLGSLALGTANGRFVRFKTDESTSYTILDTSLLNVTENVNLGLDGGTNAFGYVSGLTKAAWNFQQTDGTIIRQFYNANWKSEIYMDYRTGQMSTRGKNNGTWQDWRIHLDSGNFSSYAVPIKTGGGIAECSGNGEYLYYTIATITISGAYVNKPILFEISGRGHHFTRLEVEFASSSSTDPGLGTNGFVADGYHGFWIKKTATSTWVVYGKYTETRGNAVLHRITGCGTSEVTVTVNMTNYGNSLPDGCTQVTYGWMALLADRALRADKASKLSTSSAIGSDTQPVYFDSDGYPTACYPMSRTSTIYDNSSGTSTIISDLTIPADTKYFKIFIFDFDTSGSHYVTNVIDIGVDDGYYGGVISGSSQSQSFPCVITVVQLIVATTSNNRKQISIGRSNSWTIGTSPSSSTHTLYIRKIIACT